MLLHALYCKGLLHTYRHNNAGVDSAWGLQYIRVYHQKTVLDPWMLSDSGRSILEVVVSLEESLDALKAYSIYNFPDVRCQEYGSHICVLCCGFAHPR